MNRLSLSVKIYIGLVAVLAVLAGSTVFLPQGSFSSIMAEQEALASKPVLAIVNAAIILILYGCLGLVGVKLSRRLGFADLWDSGVSDKQRFLIPALVGVGTGLFFIFVDVIMSQLHTLGPLPHPPFPTSLVASASAGIGEEIIFRLFFITFWVWLISHVIFRKRWQNRVFWIVTLFSALAFAFGHIPSVMAIFGLKTIGEIPPALTTEMMFLNGVLSISAAYYFRKYGFLAAVGVHFWADVIWHVLWGAV